MRCLQGPVLPSRKLSLLCILADERMNATPRFGSHNQQVVFQAKTTNHLAGVRLTWTQSPTSTSLEEIEQLYLYSSTVLIDNALFASTCTHTFST